MAINELNKLVSEVENTPELTKKRKQELQGELRTANIKADERYRKILETSKKRPITDEEGAELKIYALMKPRIRALVQKLAIQ
jgi:hypothetical protein